MKDTAIPWCFRGLGVTLDMAPRPASPRPRTALYLKLGGWLEARATGWGVAAIPLIITLLVAAEAARLWLS